MKKVVIPEPIKKILDVYRVKKLRRPFCPFPGIITWTDEKGNLLEYRPEYDIWIYTDKFGWRFHVNSEGRYREA